jgi:phasin family protein
MSKSTTNPAPAAGIASFADVTKMFEQFKLPGVDMKPIIESRRKDIEALVAANKAAAEAMQALAQRQTEMFASAMQGMQESAKKMGSTLGAAPDYAKQAEIARTAYEKVLGDMKDLAEMARKSQVDAMAVINERATQSFAEMKQLMQPK